MDCKVCKELRRRLQIEITEYTGALASVCYQVTKKFAARKNVDMERARVEFEEHCRTCVLAIRVMPSPAIPIAYSALKRPAA